MARHDDDDAWRAIVENYGDRAELDPQSSAVEPAPVAWREAAEAEADDRDPWGVDEGFVPPPPPPLPVPEPVRLAAWLGVFGAPAVMLVALVLGVRLPSPLGYVLIAAFVGGFGYLVVHMDRTPRDPGDDGAVV